MQIQQNSYLHVAHTMWLQPSSFSMSERHLGQGLVFAATHNALARSDEEEEEEEEEEEGRVDDS